jgi:hypothetical protein
MKCFSLSVHTHSSVKIVILMKFLSGETNITIIKNICPSIPGNYCHSSMSSTFDIIIFSLSFQSVLKSALSTTTSVVLHAGRKP